jgi:hypothetical protein
MPLTPIPWFEAQPVRHYHDPSLSRLLFFFASGVYVIYISIFLHMLMYKKIRVLIFLCSRIPSPSELGFLDLG